MMEVRPKSQRGIEGTNGTLNRISLNPTSVVRVIGGFALFLLFCDVVLQLMSQLLHRPTIFGLVHLFNFDAEDNLPSLYSTLLLLFSSVLLIMTTIFKWRQKGTMITHWVVLATGFFLMALDEELSYHEELIGPMRALVGDQNYGIFYFAWVIPAIGLVAALGLFFLKFLNHLPRKTALRFTLAGGLYVGGCIGLELIGGRYDELHGQDNLTYIGIAIAEESMEFAGVILFIRALLVYMTNTFREVQLNIRPSSDRNGD